MFASNRKGVFDLYEKPANASANEQVLLQSPETKAPNDWSRDGRFLLYAEVQNGYHLMVLPMTGDRRPFPFLSTSFNQLEGRFSPDARWVAYQSDESGRYEIYVRPFPGPGGQWQISTAGGNSPRWSRSGKELYYIAPDLGLMAVSIAAQGNTLEPGTPAVLFRTHIMRNPSRQQYDVAPDGRFLINTELQDTTTAPITLLMNWAGLRK